MVTLLDHIPYKTGRDFPPNFQNILMYQSFVPREGIEPPTISLREKKEVGLSKKCI